MQRLYDWLQTQTDVRYQLRTIRLPDNARELPVVYCHNQTKLTPIVTRFWSGTPVHSANPVAPADLADPVVQAGSTEPAHPGPSEHNVVFDCPACRVRHTHGASRELRGRRREGARRLQGARVQPTDRSNDDRRRRRGDGDGDGNGRRCDGTPATRGAERADVRPVAPQPSDRATSVRYNTDGTEIVRIDVHKKVDVNLFASRCVG